MLNRSQVVHLAWSSLTIWIDLRPDDALRIDAAVVAMCFDGLGDQKNGDDQKAQAAENRQGQIGVSTHHLKCCQRLIGRHRQGFCRRQFQLRL